MTTSNMSWVGQFNDALALIDDNDKAEYLEAQRRCHTKIWELEANPIFFLARDAGDPWRAAQRMVDYWKGRVCLFGKRAYHPLMASAGTDCVPSALTAEDLAFLQTGHGALLPDNQDGDTVIFMDHSKLTTPALIHATLPRMRTFFYLMHKALIESKSSTAYKVHILATLCKPPACGYDAKFPSLFLQMNDYMPICIDTIHIAAVRPSISGRGWVLQFALQTVHKMFGALYARKTKVYYGNTMLKTAQDDGEYMVMPLLRELKGAGFRYSGLPECMGGSFTDDSWQQWLSKQRRRESHAFATPEDRLRKTRTLNRHHSKLKRQRRNQEFRQLQEQVEMLRSQQEAAKATNIELVRLLLLAQEIATASEAFEAHPSYASDPCNVLSGSNPELVDEVALCLRRGLEDCLPAGQPISTQLMGNPFYAYSECGMDLPLTMQKYSCKVDREPQAEAVTLDQPLDDGYLFQVLSTLIDDQDSEDDSQCSLSTLEPVPLADIFPPKAATVLARFK